MTGPSTDLSRLRIDRTAVDAPNRALRWALVLAALAVIFIGVVWLATRSRGLDVQVARVEVIGGGAGGGVGITANGYVVARTRASVSSRLTGRLAYLGVEEGSVVRRGEIMARLENQDYQAAVSQAEAERARAGASLAESQAVRDQLTRDLTRAQELLERNLESERAVEDLQSQLTAAEARVRVQEAQVNAADAAVALARANLENTLIRAPFDGTVLRKDAELGEVVAPVAAAGGLTRGAVVTMADLETLEVEVDVNEAYIARITQEQPTRIILDAYPELSFAGAVRQIVPTADRQRATVQVKVSILDRDPRILPEMGARVEFLASDVSIAAEEPPRVLVPAAAVRRTGSENVVWVVRDGVVHRTVIDAGPVSGEHRTVRAGLSGGETVVLDPSTDLEPGTRVHVIPR